MKYKGIWSSIAVCVGVGAGVFYWLSTPIRIVDDTFLELEGDADRGAKIFQIAGCASCHVSSTAEVQEQPMLSGGKAFATKFGTFYAPNISTDIEHGVGRWNDLELANAIVSGVSARGEHLYPALPYTSYVKSDLQDIRDLIAFWRTLPADDAPSQSHEIKFPFNIRRGLGLWKRINLKSDWIMENPQSDNIERGRYLVETVGHCGECHTPRNLIGAIKTRNWLEGAELPTGDGRVPGITTAELGWSEDEIVEYLATGFTPEYDTAGGEMVDVIDNLAVLSIEERTAIAAYLVAY